MHKIDLTGSFGFIPIYSNLFPLNKNQFFMMAMGLSSYFIVTIKPFNVIKVNHLSEFNLKFLEQCSFKTILATFSKEF